jgi:hypothetical protein
MRCRPSRTKTDAPIRVDAHAHGLRKRAQRRPLATTPRGNAQTHKLRRLLIDGIWPPPCVRTHQHVGSVDATPAASGHHPAQQRRTAGHVALNGPIVSPLCPPTMPLTRSGSAMMPQRRACFCGDAARRGRDLPRRVPSYVAAGTIQRRAATSTDRLSARASHAAAGRPKNIKGHKVPRVPRGPARVDSVCCPDPADLADPAETPQTPQRWHLATTLQGNAPAR